MAKKTTDPLSRRERQIMDIVYRAGKATASEVLDQLPAIEMEIVFRVQRLAAQPLPGLVTHIATETSPLIGDGRLERAGVAEPAELAGLDLPEVSQGADAVDDRPVSQDAAVAVQELVLLWWGVHGR